MGMCYFFATKQVTTFLFSGKKITEMSRVELIECIQWLRRELAQEKKKNLDIFNKISKIRDEKEKN
jgi:hypothetical protein